MNDVQEMGQGPEALREALRELGITEHVPLPTAHPSKQVRAIHGVWEWVLNQYMAHPEDHGLGSEIRRAIFVQAGDETRLLALPRFATQLRRVLKTYGIQEETISRIIVVEHHPSEPWGEILPFGSKEVPPFFLLIVARRPLS